MRDAATPAPAAEEPALAPWSLQELVVEDLVVPEAQHPAVREDFLADLPPAVVDQNPTPPVATTPPAPVAPPEATPPPPPSQPEPIVHAPTAPPASREDAPGEHGLTCAQCGAALSETDIFCGECGLVRVGGSALPRDTEIIEPFPWSDDPLVVTDSAPEPVAPEPVVPEPVVPEPGVPEPIARSTDGRHAAATPVDAVLRLDEDLEQTRIVAPGAGGDRFILQFSTGESVSVTGTGLLGRNPTPEPGEHMDTIVAISDPGKSVSKTHLEFGREGGAFWVSDRYSGNGTIVREPERPARRCEPGKRYRIARGTRVEIGEQFFIVS
ncbi:FHA domain-containing protein [Antiquaquibacter oligotrophicus]|uniref:zinc ribbon domain-containing protein n=1 Tax=Antiquaquibacter oligotrophicus TaxID=2880260 RepID=UPI002AC9422F|nr:FHA domain-containing protein [Antiquaquibacter oligotrophicus]UDF13691.1 FHA domain-containing protein [Antiquaquibacter oligotrophicus]